MPRPAETLDRADAASPARFAAVLMCAVLVAVSIGTQGHAADAQDGYRLAKQWCTSCHIVGPNEAGSDAARPFASIANDPQFTEDGIRAWLADPHPPMPNLNLSRMEVDWIVAYLRSLRRE